MSGARAILDAEIGAARKFIKGLVRHDITRELRPDWHYAEPENFGRGPGFYIEVKGGQPGFERHNHDLGEGPWENVEDALEFFENEVGLISRIVYADHTGVKPVGNWVQPR